MRKFRYPLAAALLAGLGCAAALLFGMGCATAPEGYEPHLVYDLRSDPIVLAPPAAAPTRADLPRDGRLDESLRALPARGGAIFEPRDLPEAARRDLRTALDDRFGTPAAARTPTDDPELAQDGDTLARGSAGYRARCVQCHGIPGDGRGPTGPWTHPLPRDFRAGGFKRGTAPGPKPRIDDLVRTLRAGVSGTSMPMFDLVALDELRAMAAYVVHLSVRGETELRTMKALLADDGEARSVNELVEANARRVVAEWSAAARSPVPAELSIPDPPEPAAVERGHALFVKLGCVQCHAHYGNSDSLRYDQWGFPNAVTNLRQPERRWGGSPGELANTVRRGVPPAHMPAAPLTDAELIGLVGFLRALPYPAQLPESVRATVEAAR